MGIGTVRPNAASAAFLSTECPEGAILSVADVHVVNYHCKQANSLLIELGKGGAGCIVQRPCRPL
jgi:hypothetical protein